MPVHVTQQTRRIPWRVLGILVPIFQTIGITFEAYHILSVSPSSFVEDRDLEYPDCHRNIFKVMDICTTGPLTNNRPLGKTCSFLYFHMDLIIWT